MRSARWSVVLVLFLTAVVPVAADDKKPVIDIHLDATDAPRKRLQAKLVIPVKPGALTLYYPKWVAGEHGPTGPINDLSGVKIRGGDKTIPWTRDDRDTYPVSPNEWGNISAMKSAWLAWGRSRNLR